MFISYIFSKVNKEIIYRVLGLIRKAISHYIKETYYTKTATSNEHKNIAVAESLFCHYNCNQQIWLIGLIDTYSHDFRIEAIFN